MTDVNEDGATRFARLGGREALALLVDAFYARIELDPELRPIFPEDLTPGREKQKRFLEQWLGGEPRYAQRNGDPELRHRHLPFTITAPAAERWLAHFAVALEERAVETALAAEILEGLRPIALRMVNTTDVAPPREARA